MSFSLAHFSDLHLGPLPFSYAWANFKLKRLVGSFTWHLERKRKFDPQVVAALMADIKACIPDHIAFTGDAVNLSAAKEFTRAATFMAQLAEPQNLSFTPGNHDAYVPISYDKGLGHFAPFMQGDMRSEHAFPFVRLRRNIALIGLNCAQPRGLFSSQGRLGPEQLERLNQRLIDLREKGFCCIVMVHYPPISGPKRRNLEDATQLAAILVDHKVDLVLHGHNHRPELHWLDNTVPVIGVPSASIGMKGHHPAEWNLYHISRTNGRWQIRVTVNAWQGAEFVITDEFPLEPPHP